MYLTYFYCYSIRPLLRLYLTVLYLLYLTVLYLLYLTVLLTSCETGGLFTIPQREGLLRAGQGGLGFGFESQRVRSRTGVRPSPSETPKLPPANTHLTLNDPSWRITPGRFREQRRLNDSDK